MNAVPQKPTNPEPAVRNTTRSVQIIFWTLFWLTLALLLLGAGIHGADFERHAAEFLPAFISLSLSHSLFALAAITTVVVTSLTLHTSCRGPRYSRAAIACISFTLLFAFTAGN